MKRTSAALNTEMRSRKSSLSLALFIARSQPSVYLSTQLPRCESAFSDGNGQPEVDIDRLHFLKVRNSSARPGGSPLCGALGKGHQGENSMAVPNGSERACIQ